VIAKPPDADTAITIGLCITAEFQDMTGIQVGTGIIVPTPPEVDQMVWKNVGTWNVVGTIFVTSIQLVMRMVLIGPVAVGGVIEGRPVGSGNGRSVGRPVK
jgi:uncharacterized membrane protein